MAGIDASSPCTISVVQQGQGSETSVVFMGKVAPGSAFSFVSCRREGYPFGATVRLAVYARVLSFPLVTHS